MKYLIVFAMSVLLGNIVWAGQLQVNWQGEPRELVVKDYRVQITIRNQVAHTTITQVFYNQFAQKVQGIYHFQKPLSAQLTYFATDIHGETCIGEITKRAEAQKIFAEHTKRGRISTLLEHDNAQKYKIRLSPIAQGQQRKITLKYRQILDYDDGMVNYLLPTSTSEAIEKFSLIVNIHSLIAIDKICLVRLGTKFKIVRQKNSKHIRAVLKLSKPKFPGFLSFFYTLQKKETGFDIVCHRAGDTSGYFMLHITPAVNLQAKEIEAQDFTFVLDRSASMQGMKFRHSCRAICYLVNKLRPQDRFNCITFNSKVQMLTRMGHPTKENKKLLQQKLQAISPSLSSNLEKALIATGKFAPKNSGRSHLVLLFSDARPTNGECQQKELLDNLCKYWPDNSRLFIMVLGYRCDFSLVKQLAYKCHGDYQILADGLRLKSHLRKFLNKAATPVLRDIKLNFGPIAAHDLYFSGPKELFAGRQIVLVGRYSRAAQTTVKLTAIRNGKTEEYERVYNFNQESNKPYIATMWAISRINFLLEQNVLKPELENNNRNEIERLALKYQIATPYTSFIVTEPELWYRKEKIASAKPKSTVSYEVRKCASAPSAPLEDDEQKMSRLVGRAKIKGKQRNLAEQMNRTRTHNFIATIEPHKHSDPTSHNVAGETLCDTDEPILPTLQKDVCKKNLPKRPARHMKSKADKESKKKYCAIQQYTLRQKQHWLKNFDATIIALLILLDSDMNSVNVRNAIKEGLLSLLRHQRRLSKPLKILLVRIFPQTKNRKLLQDLRVLLQQQLANSAIKEALHYKQLLDPKKPLSKSLEKSLLCKLLQRMLKRRIPK